MAIRWKVTTLDNYSIFINKKDSFCTKYLKDAILEDKNGIGFFCFKTKENAEDFIAHYIVHSSHAKIRQVETLIRGKIPKKVNFLRMDNMLDFSRLVTHIPQGTICYKKIKVLD